MRVLLVSTYELGHQPLHVAAPASELEAAGHDVTVFDLAVRSWNPELLADVDVVAISVPMHTALRLAIELATSIKSARPEMPIAFYGLYAAVGADRTLAGVADRLIGGEYEDSLVAWVASQDEGPTQTGVSVDIAPRRFRTPQRSGLPDLSEYAHLSLAGTHRVVGYVEASHGCRHRCTHCPIPVVYDGRFRITGIETVLADIDQQVRMGAGHITFGDPDFLNAPAYAMKVLEAAHQAHPDVTFDVTVKVEHILDQRSLLESMAAMGVLFMVSAMESLDDRILERLDKGHTAEEAAEAVSLVRAAGIDIHPTWLPFTPWTTAESVADIARFVWDHDLAPVTDPVQLSIRLLIPDGSLMLGIADLAPYLLGYDAAALGYRWRGADPAMDELASRLQQMAEEGAAESSDSLRTLALMTDEIGRAAGVDIPTSAIPAGATAGRPRLSEPWFC